MSTHYDIVEQAILYLTRNAKQQPNLDEVAEHVGLSPFHFQRIFHEWAGVSPKKFLQFLNIEQAKNLLRQNRSLLDTSLEVGLSGPSRLHDLFITIEGMTPGEFKNGAKDLQIIYSFAQTVFGNIIIASTEIGICYLAFCNNEKETIGNLKHIFPHSSITQFKDPKHVQILEIFQNNQRHISEIKLHLKGTAFQLKVWQALLQIPEGSITTYADIARFIHQPKSSRAVGNAIGSNPIAYLIPCHRVIRSTGIIGNYHWGKARKQAMLGWEAAKNDSIKMI